MKMFGIFLASYLLVSFLLIKNTPAYAGEKTYECTIQQIKELSKEGTLIEHDGAFKSLLNGTFTIDRDTGRMAGLPFSTESYKDVSVLDRGSKDNAYKAVIVSHSPNIWIKYIYVQEHEEGMKKPFWGTDNGNLIFSGICL